jgi:hypothetical protein
MQDIQKLSTVDQLTALSHDSLLPLIGRGSAAARAVTFVLPCFASLPPKPYSTFLLSSYFPGLLATLALDPQLWCPGLFAYSLVSELFEIIFLLSRLMASLFIELIYALFISPTCLPRYQPTSFFQPKPLHLLHSAD